MKQRPVIPKDICDEAKQFLKDIIEVLEKENILTSLDSSAVELLGNSYHIYIESSKRVKQDGITIMSPRGELKSHPSLKTMLDAQIQITKLMDSFGLTPKARKEISKPKEREGKLTPIDVFLQKETG
jgi:P27 family predicted phage terminase small subunit